MENSYGSFPDLLIRNVKTQEADSIIEGGILTDTGFRTVCAGTLKLPVGASIITVSPEKMKWGYIFGKVEKIVLERVLS